MTTAISTSRHTHPKDSTRPDALARLRQSLADKRFFKLIIGGSFTEPTLAEALAYLYVMGGADCLDIAPDAAILNAVDNALRRARAENPDFQAPPVMVSLPLDPDPHFRKIDLDEPACIRCGLCLPVCPTEALTLPDALTISQSLCYGCGRCVPACPTNALDLHPFLMADQVAAALAHPMVSAVEIHSRHVDPYMLEAFWHQWRDALRGKLISLCFRPMEAPTERILSFIDTAIAQQPAYLMLQIDGAPMSGSDDPEASRPALEAARALQPVLAKRFPELPITISGGINRYTADYLRRPEYDFIAGIGMGTVARRLVWNDLPGLLQNLPNGNSPADPAKARHAHEKTSNLIHSFQARYKTTRNSAIISKE